MKVMILEDKGFLTFR